MKNTILRAKRELEKNQQILYLGKLKRAYHLLIVNNDFETSDN
jgi:hypothetical protein